MGKPTDNKHTKNLDELLEHLQTPSDDLDAFEQEALEGFATLENKQEAIEMKQRLDKRMDEKLSEKRRPLFIYWSAAAGVALIIGLVFLLQTNHDLKQESLADNSVLNEKNLESTESNPPAPPAELKQDAVKNMGGKSDMQSANEQSMDYKKGPAQRSASDEEASTKSALAEVALDDVKNEPAKEGEKDSRRDEKPADDLAANKGQTNEEVPASASGAGSSDKLKSKDQDEAEPKATEYFSRKIKKEKSNNATPQKASQPKSEIEGTFEKSTIQSASLSIKESELTEKINKFFADKDYKKSFVCTLTINSDNKVESIVFKDPSLFHKGEQKEITEFFKKQKCFKNHEFSVYSTYTVNYKAQ
ncbi:MAG: hypothetical protein IPI93_13945 [Sphingobacteriaceae bacterium]|nr:hypothetical protein [Sphingobacteriaceae bacterium]